MRLPWVGTLVSALGNNNVLVDAAGGSGSDTVGDITVDSAVGWNSANKLTLKSSGEGGIAINAPITAQDGALKLDAGTGGISQNEAGVIATKTLEVVSEGRVTLEAGNQVGTLAANVKGSEQPFSFANKNKDLAIGTVGGTHGVSTSTYGDVIISVLETGDLTSVEGASISGETITLLTSDAASKIAADGDIIGGTGGVSLTAGKITGTGAVTSAGDLTMTTTNGEINQGKLTVTGNGATTFNAGTGDITLTNLQNSFGGFVNAIGGAISIQAAALNFGTFSNGANKAVDLRTKHGNLTLSGIIDTGTADLTLTSAGTLTTAGNLAGANVSLTGVAGLTLKHNVNAAHDLTLSSGTGVIGQTAGAMTVGGALTANAASGIYLSQSGNSAASVNLVNTASNAVDYKGTGASSSVTISGSNSGGGAFSVNIDKNINLGLISNPGGTVSLTSTDGAIHDGNGSSNNISAATATLSAKKGIGQGDAIEMTVSTVSASNSSNGDIQLDNTGALLTDGVSTGTGNVSIVTHSPMTIGGSGVSASGDIALTVGGTGAGDTLTLSGPVYSSNGNIVLTAGSTITGDNHALAPHGTVSVHAGTTLPPATPTIDQCVANPALAGCSAVLPTIAVCTTTPSAAGCSAVLPTIAVCTTTPSAPGCSAVLPTLAVCTSTPSAPGCSAVLPTTTTTTSPTLAVAELAAVAEPLQAVQGQTASAMDTIQSTAQPSSSPAASSPVALPPPVAGGAGIAQQTPLQTLPGGVVGGEAPDTFGSAPTASGGGTAGSGEPGGGGEGKNDKKSRKPGKCTA